MGELMTNTTETKQQSAGSTNLFRVLETEALLAERWAISVRTLQMWRFKGFGPPFLKVGNAVRYDPAECEEWLEKNSRSSTSDPGPDAA